MAVTSDHLDDNTDHVDTATHDDSPFAANDLGAIATDESAEEGTSREDRDDERSVGSADSSGIVTNNSSDEEGRRETTVDVTRIVTEEDTTE